MVSSVLKPTMASLPVVESCARGAARLPSTSAPRHLVKPLHDQIMKAFRER